MAIIRNRMTRVQARLAALSALGAFIVACTS
jgi:hypothetical protein